MYKVLISIFLILSSANFLYANTCLEFDGIDDYVEVNTVLPDSGTIELWFYPESFYDWNSIFDNSVDPNDWEMWVYHDGVLRFRLDDGVVSFDLATLGGVQNWYHIALMWEKNNTLADCYLYVNGELKDSSIGSNWVDPGSTIFLGAANSNTSGTGKFDELRIWDSMLELSELQETIYRSLTGTENGLISYYNFNEGVGSVLTDLAGTNNGILNNMDSADWVGSSIFCPGVRSVLPADNSNDVPLDSEFSITFDRNVTSGPGNIVIHKTSDDSVVETIPASSLTVFDSVVTIYPTMDFILQEGYYIMIEENAFHDGSDNYFYGISDKNIWNFTSLNYFSDIGAGIQGLDYASGDWGDYDNDGDMDILLEGSIGSDYALIYQNIDGDFFDANAGLEADKIKEVEWGDYDNDGDLDILITGGEIFEYRKSKIYRNDGGGFTDINLNIPVDMVSSGDWIDYNTDGDLDIMLLGANIPYGAGDGEFDYVSKIYVNNNGTFTETDVDFTNGLFGSPVWGDYDNDGDMDFLITGANLETETYVTDIYRNDSGIFTSINATIPQVIEGNVTWGDYDSDGDLDVLLTGASLSHGRYITMIYKNDSGIFSEINVGLDGIEFRTIDWGDFDNDGDLDILLTGRDSESNDRSMIFRNDSGIFTDLNAELPVIELGIAKWGDYDNDGDLDILLSGTSDSGGTSKVYKNNSTKSNTIPNSPQNISYDVIGKDLRFSWDQAYDAETPSNGLSYNVELEIDGIKITPSTSDPASGFRKVVGLGNTSLNNFYILDNYFLPQEESKTILTKVQSIDNCYAGSNYTNSDTTLVSRDLTLYNADELDMDGLLSWEIAFSNDVLNYQLQLDDDFYFNSPITDVVTISKKEKAGKVYCSIHLNELSVYDSLDNFTKYYWRMKPNYPGRITRYSLVPSSFMFNPTTAPSPVIIDVSGSFVTISWNTSKESEKGEVFNVYSTNDPKAVFPDGWDFEVQLTDTQWITMTSEMKKFYCVTAASSKEKK